MWRGDFLEAEEKVGSLPRGSRFRLLHPSTAEGICTYVMSFCLLSGTPIFSRDFAEETGDPVAIETAQ